jgi:hypothetical protein
MHFVKRLCQRSGQEAAVLSIIVTARGRSEKLVLIHVLVNADILVIMHC